MWLVILFTINFGSVSAVDDNPSIFEMYPRKFTRQEIIQQDSIDAEQLNLMDSFKRPTDNHFFAITADYDDKYMERKPKLYKIGPVQLDARTDENTFPFGGLKLNNMDESFERPVNVNYLKDRNFSNKRKIKILYDDVENTMLTTNEYDENIKNSEWEPVAYDGMDSFRINVDSTETNGNTKFSSILWESLHYDGTDEFGHVTTINYKAIKMNKELDNMDILTETNQIKQSQNNKLDSTDLLTEKTSMRLENLGKVVHRDSKESEDDDIEVFKQINIEGNETNELNATMESSVELKQVTTESFGSKENTDFDNRVLFPLNTTEINNKIEERETEKGSQNESMESHREFDIMEWLNQTTTKKQVLRGNSNTNLEHFLPESDEVLERADLLDNTEDIYQPQKSNNMDIISNFRVNQIPSTILDDTNEVFRPIRTTDYKVYGKHIFLNGTTTKRSNNFLLEKNDILFNDLLEEENQDDNITVTRKIHTTNDIPTKIVPSPRITKMITSVTKIIKKNKANTQKEEFIIQYVNHTDPTIASDEVDFIEETTSSFSTSSFSDEVEFIEETTPSFSTLDMYEGNHVSRLIYLYKKGLSFPSTQRIEKTTKVVTGQTMPDIDYDYLIHKQIWDNTELAENTTKTKVKSFSGSNENLENDEKFEWNEYNNYDEVLSNSDEETEISKWYRVLPLDRPKKAKKMSSNFIPLYTDLIPEEISHFTTSIYTTSHPKPKRTTPSKVFTTQKSIKKFLAKTVYNSDVVKKNMYPITEDDIPGKGIFNMKIRRKNSTHPYLKITTKKTHVAKGGGDISENNNWPNIVKDDVMDDELEFIDRAVTNPVVLEPNDMDRHRDADSNKKLPELRKRNIKSTLYDEQFKAQNLTHLITIIYHNNASNRSYKNMVQRTQYRKERRKRDNSSFKVTPLDKTLVDAKSNIIENNIQSNCLKNILYIDDEYVPFHKDKIATSTNATFNGKPNIQPTETPQSESKHQLTTLEKYNETIKSEKRMIRNKPSLPKLLLDENRPPSRHAKYKKKSQIKLGNIWRFMENPKVISSTPKSNCADIICTRYPTTILSTEKEIIESKRANTAKYQPKSNVTQIVSRTTINPILSFIKTIIDSQESDNDDTESVNTNKTGHSEKPESYEPITVKDRKDVVSYPVPTIVNRFTQKPMKLILKKYTAPMTVDKYTKEPTLTEKITERYLELQFLSPIIYKTQQLDVKPSLDKKLNLPTNEINTIDCITQSYRRVELQKFLKTTERPETISLKPVNLFDPPSNLKSYSKRIGRISSAKVENSNAKQKNKLPSLKRSHVWMKFLPTSTPPFSFGTEWMTSKSNIVIKKIIDKSKIYKSIFENISNTNNDVSVPLEVHNELLHPKEKEERITKANNTGQIEFSLVKLHVPSSFRKNNIVSTTIEVKLLSSSRNQLSTKTSTAELHEPYRKTNVPSTTTELNVSFSENNVPSTTTELNVPLFFSEKKLPSTTITRTELNVPFSVNVPAPTTTTTEIEEDASTECKTENNNKQTPVSASIKLILKPLTTTFHTLLAITPNPKQEKAKHWIHSLLNKYSVIVPRLDNVNYLPYMKSDKNGSKIFKHWGNKPSWVLPIHFWNKLHSERPKISPENQQYRYSETTTEDVVVNFYFKKNINIKTELGSMRPTLKIPRLPEIKRINVVPLVTTKNQELKTKEFNSTTFKNYESTSKVYPRTTREPTIKANEFLLLREEARAKEMDEYRLLLMDSTTHNPNEKFTDWRKIIEFKWPPTMISLKNTTKEPKSINSKHTELDGLKSEPNQHDSVNDPESEPHNIEVNDDFPNYQDLKSDEDLDVEEDKIENNIPSKKNRRSIDKFVKTPAVTNVPQNIVTHSINENEANIKESDDQREQKLLDDAERMLKHYFMPSKLWEFINITTRTTAATTMLPLRLTKGINKPTSSRKQAWSLHAITQRSGNFMNTYKPNIGLLWRPRRNILTKIKTIPLIRFRRNRVKIRK